MRVSIHHMLLFIMLSEPFQVLTSMFQYITCYSLSVFRVWIIRRFTCFNTSHVTLYQGRKIKMADITVSFNTSHVTLYHGRIWSLQALY